MAKGKGSELDIRSAIAGIIIGLLIAWIIPSQTPNTCRLASIPQIWFEQDSYIAPARSQLVNLSRRLGASAARMSFYEGLDGEGSVDQVSRSIVTEDIDPESTEISLPIGKLPVRSDDYYIRQLETHLLPPGEACYAVASSEISEESIAKRWAEVAGISYVFSCPIRNAFQDPVGYTALTFTDSSLPSTISSIIAQLASTSQQISEDFQKR